MSTVTLKLVLRKDKERYGMCPINIRVIKNRKVSYITTGKKIFRKDWNEEENKVRRSYPNSAKLNYFLQKMLAECESKVLDAEAKDFTISGKRIKDVVTGKTDTDFFGIAAELCQKYKANKSIGTHDKVQSIITKLKVYVNSSHLVFTDIDTRFLYKYELYLVEEHNNKVNTIGKDMRFIRTVFNYAINQGLLNANINPFRGYKIKTESTQRTYLTIEEIELLKGFEGSKVMNRCRDIALFQYYSGGLRISDALSLRPENVQNKTLNLEIRKTGKQMAQHLNGSAEILVKKHLENGNNTVFGFLPNELDFNNAIEVDNCINNATALINKNLKIITQKVGVNKSISTHSMRHSFAINALKKRIPIENIQKILQHSNLRETMIYAKVHDEDVQKSLADFDK